jgi:hypothetical protein
VTVTIGGGLTTVTATAELVEDRPEFEKAVAVSECDPDNPVVCHIIDTVQLC